MLIPSAEQFPIGHSLELDRFYRDPNYYYVQLRQSEPVSYVPALKMYFITRYEDAQEILKDDVTYVVGTEKSLVYDTFGEHMMTVEGEAHNRYKNAHRPFFAPRTIRSEMESRIQTHVDQLINGFADQGEVNLRRAFASRLPIQTMLSLFGLPAQEELRLREWYDCFEAALANFTWEDAIRDKGRESADRFHELLQHYLDESISGRGTPGSLLHALTSVPENERLSDDEIRRNALIIFFGGISTVEALILNTLYALSNHPEILMQVREDVSLIPTALTETIRWLGPVQTATRHVTRETNFRGVTFQAGDTVNCMLASANRDPDIFEDPDRFDIFRPNANRHMGFATGPHHCLGSNLARLEARVALERLFLRLPELRLDPDRTSEPEGYEFRQPARATAVWVSG